MLITFSVEIFWQLPNQRQKLGFFDTQYDFFEETFFEVLFVYFANFETKRAQNPEKNENLFYERESE